MWFTYLSMYGSVLYEVSKDDTQQMIIDTIFFHIYCYVRTDIAGGPLRVIKTLSLSTVQCTVPVTSSCHTGPFICSFVRT